MADEKTMAIGDDDRQLSVAAALKCGLELVIDGKFSESLIMFNEAIRSTVGMSTNSLKLYQG